jgi:hypothetical protein
MTRNGLPREVRTPETEDAVLQSFEVDGRRSIFEELYRLFDEKRLNP